MADTQDLDSQDTLDQQQGTQESQAVRDWRESLDPSIKNHPSLGKYKGVGDLAKAYIDAHKLIGVDKIPVPSEKVTKADWDMVFERLGRPKDKDGYEIPDLKLPEGYPAPNKEFMEEFKGKALELGMLPAQVNGLYKWFMDQQVNEFNQYGEQRNNARGEAENALRKMWGRAFEQNVQIAEQAVNKYGSEEFRNKLKQTGLNNDPDMIRFIADMAKNFSEDKITGRQTSFTKSPEEARAEISKIQAEAMRDKNHPMNNKHHPEYKYFLDNWTSLHKMANPDTV